MQGQVKTQKPRYLLQGSSSGDFYLATLSGILALTARTLLLSWLLTAALLLLTRLLSGALALLAGILIRISHCDLPSSRKTTNPGTPIWLREPVARRPLWPGQTAPVPARSKAAAENYPRTRPSSSVGGVAAMSSRC